MKTFFQVFGIFVGVIAFIFLMSFIGNAMGLFNVSFWGTKHENARRQVFEQTQSYVEGKRQELIKYHHEWVMAKDDDTKKVIETTIRSGFANFDESKIEQPELYNFLKKCKYQ